MMFPLRHLVDPDDMTHYTSTADVCSILTYLVEDWKASAGGDPDADGDLFLFAAAMLLERVVDTLTVEAIGQSSMDVS